MLPDESQIAYHLARKRDSEPGGKGPNFEAIIFTIVIIVALATIFGGAWYD